MKRFKICASSSASISSQIEKTRNYFYIIKPNPCPPALIIFDAALSLASDNKTVPIDSPPLCC